MCSPVWCLSLYLLCAFRGGGRVCVDAWERRGECGMVETGCLVVSHCPSVFRLSAVFAGFCCLLSKSPCRHFDLTLTLSGLAAAAMAAEAAQHCVCVCNCFCCRRSANCVGQHRGGSICRRDCATVFFCSLFYFVADLWLLSCVSDEVAGLLSVRCLCVCVARVHVNMLF